MVQFKVTRISQRKDVIQFVDVYGKLLRNPDDPEMAIQKILYILHKEGVPGQEAIFLPSDNMENINEKIEIKFAIPMETSDSPSIRLKQFIEDLNKIVEVTGNIANIKMSK
jgi:hypothetical protein